MAYSTLHCVYVVTVLIVASGVLVRAQECVTSGCSCSNGGCCFHVNEEGADQMFVGSATVHPDYMPSSDLMFTLETATIDTDDFIENFTVNSVTGEIRTTQLNIDVDNSAFCCIPIIISADGDGGLSLWTFAVEIDDINDNAPEFENNRTNITVEEGLKDEVEVCPPQAMDKDRDVSTNKNITYRITGGGDMYFIIPDATSPRMRNIVELDRDTAESDPYTLSFTLEATDAGVHKQHSSTLAITIVVEDINDNAPEFVSEHIQITVPENTRVNDIIELPEVQDPDAGANGELRYEIISFIGEGFPFSMNRMTGDLLVVEKLDWEVISGREHIFQIRATDMGNPPISSDADVTVTISDVNEKIDINFEVPEGNMLNVSEDDVIDKVLSFTVIDTDNTDNQNNTIELLSGKEYFSARRLPFSDDFIVSQHTPIDREVVEVFILSIIFIQGGRPEFNDTINITVNVLDINDNYPRLNQTSFEIVENDNGFQKITELGLFARDPDEGENGTIVSYELISVTSDLNDLTEYFLMVDDNVNVPVNGLLQAPTVDRETHGPILNFTMRLTDGGGNSALLSFTVEILDLNDQVPVFTNRTYEFHIMEEKEDQVAGSVTARDDDKGMNGTVTYHLEQPSDDFMINNETGEIASRPNKIFDREQTPYFTLYVTASDNGDPPMPANTTATVIIIIDDENDHLPEFDPNQITSFTVESNAAIGTQIGQIVATDKDVGVNAQIHYKIEPSNDFDINLMTGYIIVAQPLTTDEMFNLTVTAYNDPRDNSTSLDITITVTPASSSSVTDVVVIAGAIIGVMIVLVLLALLLVVLCYWYQKRKRGKMQLPSSPSSLNNGDVPRSIMKPPVNSITGGTLRVTFKEEVVKRMYDVGQSVNSDTLDTESAINLDSSDESQTPPRIRQNGNIHTSESLGNGVVYPQQQRQHAPFSRIHELELSEGSMTDEHNHFDGNSDDDSTFSDDASNVNASLPIFGEHHMRYHPHPAPFKQAHTYSPPHVTSPLAALSHPHVQVDVHHSGSLTLTPPDSHHSNSLSSQSPTPPYHQILASLATPSNHHPLHTLSSSRNYPAVMPDALGTPVMPISTHYTPSFDYEYTSTYASSDLDEELKFNDTEPGFCSLTADVYSDEESDSQL